MTCLLRRFMLGAALVWLVTGQIQRAAAGPTAYIVGHDYFATGPDLFGQVDVATGAFKLIGDLSTPGYTIFGMGYGADGNLYGVGYSFVGSNPHGELFGINPTTAGATDLGPLAFDPAGASSNSSGTLYALDAGSPSLLRSISPPSNSSNIIGSTTFTSDGLVAIDAKGNLFASGNADGSFFKVNTTDASSTLIGNTGLGPDLYAGAFVGSTLYGFSANATNSTIVTINTSNADVTIGANVGMPTNYLVVAAISSVPEPSSVVLGLIAGISVLACGLPRGRIRQNVL